MRKALGWIFNRWVLGMLGLIAISLIIWYVGPLVEIAKFAPLEPAWIRQLLIAIVIIVYLGKLLWRAGRAALANRKLMDGLLKSGPKDPVPAAPQRGAEEVATLAKRFQVAIDVLKRANVDSKAKRAGFRALSVFRRRQYLYDLPWYMIIGAPGSGKTTALLNAGLNFPLADRLGKDAIRGIGGTRNCDWWFTDEAVLLDTAGRYTTQDSDAQADQVAWNGFLGLLKQHRPRRPINGVFVALSVADLAERPVADRTAHANKLRARIQELHQSVGIRFPIYVLITKVDLLAGFTEFFNDLGKDDRAQVWGVTFPFAGESATEMDSLASSKAELEQLGRRLNERLIDRLQAERDPQRRSLIYGFPQQWSLLTDTLNEFLDAVFAPSRFEQKPLVRGVYFTSGTQEGMPIDRLFGALGRALGLARQAQCPPAESGRSFFLSRLLKEVVFRESDLAGTNFKWVRRRALIQTGAVVGMLVLIALAIIAWGVSYSRNKAYVAEVNSKVVAIAQQIEAPQSSGHDLVGLLPLMNSVRDLASTSPDASDATPFSMGFGLYQGDKLDIASRSAYQRLLRDAFLPRLTARIEKQLAGDDRNNPELQYEALRTYLMLHDAKRYDGDAVRAFIETDWNGTLPRDLAIDRRKELSRHLETLLGLPEVASPLSPNEALIAQARTAIGRTPLAERAYSRLKRFGVGADIPAFTITKEGGPSALLVIVRASGRPLTEGIPGLYTYNGYHKAFRAGTEKVVKQLAGEAQWVMGESSSRMAGWLPGPARESLANEVLRLYLEDYARLWEAFIKDIHVVRAGDLQKGIQITQVLGSGVESPLPKLFRAIVREVTLGQVPEAQKTLIDKGADALKEKSEDLRKLLGQTGVLPTKQADQTLVERIVDARFEYLRRLVTPGSGGKAPIDEMTSTMGEVNAWLMAADSALKQKLTPPPADGPMNKSRGVAASLTDPLSSIINQLVNEVARIVVQMARGNNEIELRDLVRLCHKAINGRYPFVRSATEDVRLDDFADLFGPGRKIDEFFRAKLESQVDTATNPWTYKPAPGAVANQGSAALQQFQRAKVIREVFFRSGASPAMRLEFKPVEMDAAITNFTLDLDGDVVRYSHGPQVVKSVQWPGPSGRQQVRIEISPTPPSGQGAILFQGPWALFRMVERAQLQSIGPEKFLISFVIDGRKAQFEVATSSVRNPFTLPELAQFQCPGV